MSADGERELPAGWDWVNLAQVCDVTGGIQKQAKRRPVQNKFPFLRVANVGRGSLDLGDIHEVELFEGELERFRLTNGDLLVVEGNGSPDQVGRAALWHGAIKDAVHQNHLIRVRPTSVIDPRFLELLWNSPDISAQLLRVAQSTSGLYTLSTSKLNRVEFALPPLAEQRRIVEALEEQLSRIDAAVASLDAGRRRARGLGPVTLTAVLGRIGDVPVSRLADLLSEPLRNGHSAKATTDSAGIRTLNLTAVTQNDFSDTNTKLTVADPHRVRDLWLTRGDILVQRSNTPDLVGTTAMYEGPDGWAIFPDLLIRVRVSDDVLPEYVTLVLQSRRGRTYFKSRAKGLAGSMPKIDQAAIEGFTIPVPPLEVQKRVVAEMQDELERVSRVSSELDRARKRSAGLRNALLRTAFSGALLPQDPNDEPARVVLARVATERAAEPKVRRPRKATTKKLARRPAPRTAVRPAPEPTATPALAVQQEFDL
ncbi:restriction endonuclease subunit S [Streptomyces phaeochromogenes]